MPTQLHSKQRIRDTNEAVKVLFGTFENSVLEVCPNGDYILFVDSPFSDDSIDDEVFGLEGSTPEDCIREAVGHFYGFGDVALLNEANQEIERLIDIYPELDARYPIPTWKSKIRSRLKSIGIITLILVIAKLVYRYYFRE